MTATPRVAVRPSVFATTASPLRSGALASSSLHLVGLRLTVPTNRIDVPKDAPFSVPVAVWIGDHQASPAEVGALVPPEAALTGTLTGPGISSPLMVSGSLASGLSLPGLTAEGDFTLSNIRLMKGGTTVMEADPKTVNIRCLGEVIISGVTSTPMTMQEIRDAGIQLGPGNYEGRRFTMALSIGSQQVNLAVPVVVPIYNGLEDPRAGGSLGRLEIQNLNDSQSFPDLAVVMADLLPEKDPFSLSRPAVSQTLQHGFKALIVIPGSIGFLHQFYKVNLVVLNALKEGSPFQITHLSTTLRLPPGADGGVGTLDDPLRLAGREGETSDATKPVRGPGTGQVPGTGDPVLKAGESGLATFFVEALKEGAHQLDFDIRAQFEGGGLTEPIPLLGRAQGKVLVRNPSFNLVLVHPDVVRKGEEYTLEARLTNTSSTLANGVTATLDRARLGSVKLVEDLNSPVDTLKPGETTIFKFRLRALRNGEVRSSYLYIEQGTIGFQLTTGLGERNIRLNPDTLLLPQTLEGRKGLPEPLREAMLRVLGQAYSIATTKGALPPGVRPIAMSAVTGTMGRDLSEQGLFFKMGIDKARVWKRLWDMFMQNPDPGFDQLVRTTEAGHQLRQAFLGAWTWADPSHALVERLGEMAPWEEAAWTSSMAAVDGAKPGLVLDMVDAQGNRIASPDPSTSGLPTLGTPFGAWGNSGGQHFISLPAASAIGARLTLTNRGGETQSIRLATAAPVAGGTPTSNRFEFELGPGKAVLISLGASREGTATYLGADGSAQVAIPASGTQDLPVEPFKVLAVHRYDIELDPFATPYGTHVMMLFNRPSMALNLPSGNEGFNAAKALVDVEANVPWKKVMASDPNSGEVPPSPPAMFKAYPRVVSLYMERPVGPYVTRRLTFMDGWTDGAGRALAGERTWPIACGDIPGGALVRGKVRKVNGMGLPATLTYWYQANTLPGNIDLATGLDLLEQEGIISYYALVTNLQTEPDGSYQLDYVPEPVSYVIGPMLLKGATAEGTAWAQASVLGNGQLIEMDLVLEGKGTVDGYVLDAQGAVVPGAMVQIIQEQPSNPLTAGTGGGTFTQSAITDANGYYRMDNLKTGVFSIRALKGLLGAATSGAISRDGEIVHQNVVLESPTGTLKARLLDTNGQAVLTQNIRLGIASGLMRNSGSAATLVWPEQATPAADGWVTFSNVPAGDVGLMVPGLPKGTVTDWRGFLDPVTSQEITLKMLPPAERAYGHFLVVDAAGNPVQGVYLSESPRAGDRSFAITDEIGTVSKRPVPAGGSFQVYAYHPAWPGLTQSESVIVQPGEDRLIRTTMPPRGTLHGTVKHPDGTPVKGAYVAVPPVFDDMKKNRLAITDAKGAFILPNVQVGTPFRLAAVGPELRTAMTPLTIQVADGQDLTLALTVPFVGNNQVGGVIYQPLEGAQKIPTMAQVWVDGLLPDITPVEWGNEHWGLLGRETTGATSTGVEGKYTFAGLPEGTYTLHASSDFFPVEVKSGGDFADKVNDAQTRDIYLSSSFAGELKGAITKRDGQTPVPPGVRVRLIGGRIGELIVHTVEDGKYRFPKVIPEGCYKLRVEDPFSGDITIAKVEMTKESSQAKNLRLWGKGTLTVQVQDSFGRILPEGVVTLSHAKSGRFDCPYVPILDADDLPPMAQKLKPEMEGVLIFDDLLEGSVSVGLKNPTGLQGMASVSIPEGGGNAEVVVRLQPVGDVLGTLFRADGTLVSAGRVDAYQGGRWLGVSPTRMDGVNGRFRFQVLPTGPISLEAWDPDSRQMGKGVVNVEASQTSEVSITTHDKGPVVITVTQEGQAAVGVAIQLAYWGGDALNFSTESTSDANGRATFYLPPGDYTASATDPLSLAVGSGTFSRNVDQGEIQTSIVLQAVRSLWATAVPPPGAVAGFSLEGWSLRDRDMGRLVQLDAKGQGMLRDLPVGSRALTLTDLRGRQRGDFTASLTVEGGAVQTPAAPLHAVAYGNLDVTVVDAHGQPKPDVAVYSSGGTIYTDSNGLARFLGLRAGNLTTWTAGASSTVLLQNEGETVRALLQQPPTASLHGTVFDPLGQPMPYVLVSTGALQTATDGLGQFRMSGLGLGTYAVTALSSSGRRAAVSVTLTQADQEVEVRLDFPPQGSLTGTVKDPLRAVPPPIHVMVYLATGGNQVGDTYTNGLGAFRFASLPAGQDLRVVGILDDGRTQVFSQVLALAPQEGATLNLDLTMPALVNVKGWTLDTLGNKIPMTVLLLDDQGRTLDKAVTTGDLFDPDHPTFFFRYLLAGHRYRLMGLQEMTSTAIAYLDYTPAGDKELEELILQAQARRGARVQVRYPDGTPTPGPGHFVITSQSVLGGRWEGGLGADGSALVQDLPEGPATVSLTGLLNQPALAATFTIPAQSAIYDVTVPAVGLGGLTVKVQTASGRVLTGGVLAAQGPNTPRWTGVAQGDGTYRLDSVWIGVPLSLQATGFGLVGNAPAVILAQHGQQLAQTYPAPDQGSLSGVVRDSRGIPVAGALLSTAGRTATTDAAGAYQFPNLPLGPYTLVATVPSRVERAVLSTLLGSDGQSLVLEVPLKGTGSIRVHVVRPDGTPVSSQSVSVRNTSIYSDGRVLTVTTDQQGMASFSDVLEGDVRANAVINGTERAASGSLVAGGTLTLDIQTKDVSTISGQVRRASTTPWPGGSTLKILGLTVPLQSDGTLAGPFPTVDYTASLVPVLVSAGGLREINAGSIYLIKNGTTTLDLTAPAFGVMAGVVKDAHGAPVPGAMVSTSGTTVSTDAQGAFRIEGLTLGSYQLLATIPNRVERGLASGNIALEAEIRTYTIALKGTGTVRVTTLAADGTPLQGQTVKIRNYSTWSDDETVSLVTDGQGLAVFTGALEGSITASATLLNRSTYQSGTLGLDGTLNLTLKVRDYTTISGRIQRASVSNVWPLGTKATLAGQSYDLDADGALALPTPNPQVDFGSGTALVFVNVPNGIELTVGTVSLAKNGETVVDLTAPGYGSLSGTIKMQDGTPASGIQVRVDSWIYLTTDASGAWRLPMIITGSHSVVAQTSTAIASGTLTLSVDGGTAGIDLTLVSNTVSLPVSMTLGRLGSSVSLQPDGWMYTPSGYPTRPFVSVDGAAETVPVPLNGIAQWIVRDRQLSYTTQIGSLEVTVIRTAAADAVSVKEEIRFRNADAASHRVALRHAISMSYLQGLPSGNGQPVLTGTSRDIGMVSYYGGTILWGDGALAPAAADTSGVRWPEVTLAPGDVKTVALAYAPYQSIPYAGWGIPRFRPEGAARLTDRLIHGASDWTQGSDPAGWMNWLAPQTPLAPALLPWDATLSVTLKDAFGNRVKNQISGTFLPRETLAPTNGVTTGYPLANQPRDGGLVSLTINGNPSVSWTRDLPSTGAVDVLATDGASLSANVRDSHGNPMASANVIFPYAGGDTTDVSGNTGLWLMAPGNYDIQATMPNSDSTVKAVGRVSLASGQTQVVNLSFPAVGGLQVAVLEPNGLSYTSGIQGTVKSSSGADRWSWTSNGVLAWSNLMPGSYTLSIQDPRTSGGYLAPIPIVINGDVLTQTTVRLPGLGQVQVTVLDPLGNRVPKGQYVAIKGADGGSRAGYTDDSGTVVFSNLAPGAATISVTNSANSFSASVIITVLDGQVVPAQIQLPGSGSLRFTLTNAGGVPLQGRQFRVTDGTEYYGGYYGQTTDATGLATFTKVRTGLQLYLRDANTASPWSPAMPDQAFTLQTEQEVRNLSYTLPVGDLLIQVTRNGSPVPYQSFTLGLEGTVNPNTYKTDAQGNYQLRQIPSPATYRYKAGTQSGTISMRGGSLSYPIALPATAPLTVNLLRANGQPAPGFSSYYQGWTWKATPGDEAGSSDPSQQGGGQATWPALASDGFQTVRVSMPLNATLGGWYPVWKGNGGNETWASQGEVQIHQGTNAMTLALPVRASAHLSFVTPAGNPITGTMAGDAITFQMLTSPNTALVGQNQATSSFNDGLSLGDVLTEGIHHGKLSSSLWGDLGTVDITVGPGDDGKTLAVPVTLPWSQNHYRLQALASDGVTPAIGTSFLLEAGAGTQGYLNFYAGSPVEGGFWAPSGRSVNLIAQFTTSISGQTITASQAETTGSGTLDRTMQLPLTVVRSRLKDLDGTWLPSLKGIISSTGQDPNPIQLPMVTVGTETYAVLLGETPGTPVELTLFDDHSGIGQKAPVTVPPLGPATTAEPTMPAYGWMEVPSRILPDGSNAATVDISVASSDPALVFPAYAEWQSGVPQGSPEGSPAVLSPVRSDSGNRVQLDASGARPFRAPLTVEEATSLTRVRVPLQGTLWAAQVQMTQGEGGTQIQPGPWGHQDFALANPGDSLAPILSLANPEGLPVSIIVQDASGNTQSYGVNIQATSPVLPRAWSISTWFDLNSESGQSTGILPALPSFRFFPSPEDAQDFLDWTVPMPLPTDPLVLVAPHLAPYGLLKQELPAPPPKPQRP